MVVHCTADEVKFGKGWVEAEVGISLHKFILALAKRNLGGLDFLANIPGSIGGAVVGNAGCYGKAVGDYVQAVTVFNMATGRVEKLTPRQMHFGYRNSICKRKPAWVVLKTKAGAEAKTSAGAFGRQFFKNVDGQATWKLIDAVGLRGKRVGGAVISNKHPNFIINRGGASASDINTLVALVQKKIWQKTKIRLEPEVRRMNEQGIAI